MTGAEFRRHYHDVDAVVVSMAWELYLRVRDVPTGHGNHTEDLRPTVVAIMDRLQDRATRDIWSRRQLPGPPMLHPVS
jgi:hypothetical protein